MADSARRANESPRSGIILNSKGKLAAENKQEGAKLSSFAPSEQVTQSAPAIIQSYNDYFPVLIVRISLNNLKTCL